MIGEPKRARALCQKLLSFAGPLQLYAEEIDTSTGEHMGNFPQAFTHLALIEAVSLLIDSEQAANNARLVRVAGRNPARPALRPMGRLGERALLAGVGLRGKGAAGRGALGLSPWPRASGEGAACGTLSVPPGRA